MAGKKNKTELIGSILEEYLNKDLPAFSRGDADCCAWVAGYANSLMGKHIIDTPPITYGEAVRLIRYHKGLAGLVTVKLEATPFKFAKSPQDGDIIVYQCDDALGGGAVGIYKENSAITRMEGESLHITQDPKIVACWRFS